MKCRFLLLTALLCMAGTQVWADDLTTTEIDGVTYYEIDDAADLLVFTDFVNNGQYDANAVLTANIDMASAIELDGWTPIGASKAYVGHFDGQGHTITGFNVTANQNNYGFFGSLSTGALVENFSISGTIDHDNSEKNCGLVGYAAEDKPTIRNIHSYLNFNNTLAGARIGGILGATNTGTVIVENCTYSGTLDGNDNAGNGNYGGIVGYIQNNETSFLEITNCLFDGQLINTAETPGNCTFGGMVGYVGASPEVKIANCLSIGTVQSAITGQFFGAVKHNTCSIVNSFYQGDNINGSASTKTPNPQEVTKVTDEQLASGEVCFKLNGDQTEINWFQTLIDDAYPTPNGTDVVYVNGKQHCDGSAYEDVTGYSNSPTTKDEHIFVDGFCSYCDAFDKSCPYMTANEEGIYEIGNGKQLKWFAANANEVNHAANGVLTNDIDLSGIKMLSIGTSSAAYTGQFDGQGHKITGFEMTTDGRGGLFGDVTNATICNFSVSGKFTATAGTGSGLIAWATNSTISNVCSILDIDVPVGGVHHVGGVVGSARGGNTVEGCAFAGTMKVAAGSTDNFAGVVAYLGGDDIIGCANYGTISFDDANCTAGGVTGYLNNKNTNIKYCLNVGKVEYSGEGTPNNGGAIVGRLRTFDTAKLTDNAWLEGSAYGGGRNEAKEVLPAAVSVTKDMLSSGEVTVMLAPYFRQNIGTDETPVLDTTHGIVTEIPAIGYATLYVPDTDVTIPAGVNAYTGVIDEATLKLNALKDAIAADEPVVLKGEAGYYSFIPTTGAEKAAKNDLKGAAEDLSAAGKYVLDKPEDDAVGFYKAESGSIKYGQAYLEVESEATVLYLTGDNPTGIKTLSDSSLKNADIYNLAGQRMGKVQKGICIVNGKKFAVR